MKTSFFGWAKIRLKMVVLLKEKDGSENPPDFSSGDNFVSCSVQPDPNAIKLRKKG
jgi:hypothetical protein